MKASLEESQRPHPAGPHQSLALVCLTPSLGGLELNLVKLGLWLQAQGVRVHFFARPESPSMAKARQFGLPVEPLTKNRKYMDLKAARQLRARCVELDIDNLLCSDNQDLDLILWSKILSRRKLKTFYLQQMQLGVSKRDLVHSLKFRWLDHWLAPLEWLKEQALQRTRLAPEKIIACPLGVDTGKFETLISSQAEARRELDLPENLFLFGFLGRTDPGKGLHTLIEAFNRVADHDPHVGLLVVSAFPKEGGEHWDYGQQISRQKEASPHRERIFFRPFTDQVERVFKCMDVFVMASVAETVGMVTIEAMLSRVPVIGANRAGTPELLDFGRAGLLFEVEDSQDLALKMQNLKEEKEQGQRLADQAFVRAKNLYSAQQMCNTIQSQLL